MVFTLFNGVFSRDPPIPPNLSQAVAAGVPYALILTAK